MRTFPNVAFVAGTLGRGGAERQLYYQLRVLTEAGARPTVASLTRGEHWEEGIRELGVPVHWFGRSDNAARRTADLVAILARARPDIVQSAHFHTNLYAIAAARALSLPEIGAIRSDTTWAIGSLGRFGRASLRLPRHIAVNSLNGLGQATEAGVSGARLTFLPNAVDTGLFTPTPPDATVVRLLSAGRLVDLKRHDRFLRLIRRLVEARPHLEVRATLVGEGPLRAELDVLARELGVAHLLTYLVDADMPAVYREATIFVLTSDAEGTPNVVLEAMAAGLPVVATDVGGVAELITGPNLGWVVAPNDEDALFDAVVAIADQPSLAATVGAAAREDVTKRFGVYQLGTQMARLYRRTLGLSRPAGLRTPVGAHA